MTRDSQAEEFPVEEYEPDTVASFRKTKRPANLKASDEFFGGLSNMAGGFSVRVSIVAPRFDEIAGDRSEEHHRIVIPTSEALYQALRFPERRELQHVIISQTSPMTAKMKAKVYRDLHTRQDWDDVRVDVMRWCLRVKLAWNWDAFGDLLRRTGEREIVEESRRDAFWGAKPAEGGHLRGRNVLGKLLMELREEMNGERPERLRTVEPLNIPSFLLYDQPIERVTAPDGDDSALEASRTVVQAPLLRQTAL